jgi:hypothetical protein
MTIHGQHRVYCAATAVAIAIAIPSCAALDDYLPGKRFEDVEVSPGKFITVEKRDWTVDDRGNRSGKEKTWIRVPFGGKSIEWQGPDIPVVLREMDGKLYMVGYDRETGWHNGDHLGRYNYYAQDGDRLVAIGREKFPKELATQNMWLRDPEKRVVALQLDTSDVWFRRSMTAEIWCHLLDGKPIPSGRDADKELLDKFLRTYHPIKLTGANAEGQRNGETKRGKQHATGSIVEATDDGNRDNE